MKTTSQTSNITPARALVLSGDGLNCEVETLAALTAVGFEGRLITVNQLIEQRQLLQDIQVLALPGGFSFGDELGSGALLALKLEHYLGEEFEKFLARDTAMLGICNGFQVLVRMGLLPRHPGLGRVSLTRNTQGHFSNRWVEMKVAANTRCLWLQELKEQRFLMPMRHGEGRLLTAGEQELQNLIDNGLVAFHYTQDVNGSQASIAGLNDPTGKILGLMPHPEAAMDASIFAQTGEEHLGVCPDGRSACHHLFQQMAKLF